MNDRLARFLLPAVFAMTLIGCDNPVDGEEDHIEAAGVQITDVAGTAIATYHEGSWTFSSGAALRLTQGEEQAVKIYFVAPDGDRFQLPHSGGEHTLRVEIVDPTIVAYHDHGDHGDFEALAVGTTTVKIQLYHGGHPDFETVPGLPIEVVAATS